MFSRIKEAANLSNAAADAAKVLMNTLGDVNQAQGQNPRVTGIASGILGGKSVTVRCIGCHAPLTGLSGKQYRCGYCDTIQTL